MLQQNPQNKQFMIYILDDDEAIIDSLVWLIEGWGYQIKAFDHPEKFIRELQSQTCVRPVAALVDVRMPYISGLEMQNWLLENYPYLPIAIMTAHADIDIAVECLKKGALDFLQKPFAEAQIKNILERLEEKAYQGYNNQNRDILLKKLTVREQEVLAQILNGLINKQIAEVLNVSVKTVEAHRSNIMNKLQANTVADLVKLAIEPNVGKMYKADL